MDRFDDIKKIYDQYKGDQESLIKELNKMGIGDFVIFLILDLSKSDSAIDGDSIIDQIRNAGEKVDKVLELKKLGLEESVVSEILGENFGETEDTSKWIEIKSTKKNGEKYLSIKTILRLDKEYSDLLGIESIFPENITQLNAKKIRDKYRARYDFIQMLSKARNNKEQFKQVLNLVKRRIAQFDKFNRFIQTHGETIEEGIKNDSEDIDIREKRQLNIFEDIYKFFESGEKRGRVIASMGIGKSVVIARTIENTGMRAVVISPKSAILKGLSKEFRTFAPNINIGVVDKDTKNFSGDATITTNLSFLGHAESGAFSEENPIDVIIVDEVDWGNTEKMKAAFDMFPDAIVIGFSATDYNMTKRDGVMIHELRLDEAIQNGFAAPIKPIFIDTTLNLEDTIENGRINQTKAAEKIRAQHIEDHPAKIIEEYFLNYEGLGTVFVGTADQADRVSEIINNSEILKQAGFTSESLHYKKSDEENAAIIERFRKGETKCVVSVGKIGRGFNNPKISWVINLNPTLVKSNLEQKIGRATRITEDENKIAVVVDIIYDFGTKRQALTTDVIGVRNFSALFLKDYKNEVTGLGKEQEKALQERLGSTFNVIQNSFKIKTMVSQLDILNGSDSNNEIPEGWITISSNDTNFERYMSIVEEFLVKMGEEDSESKYFKRIIVSGKEIVRAISPDLVQYVRKEMKKGLEPPNGYMIDSNFYPILFSSEHRGHVEPKYFVIMEIALEELSQEKGIELSEKDFSSKFWTGQNTHFVEYRSPELMNRMMEVKRRIDENSNDPNKCQIEELVSILGRKRDTIIDEISKRIRDGRIDKSKTWLGWGQRENLTTLYDRDYMIAVLEDLSISNYEHLGPENGWYNFDFLQFKKNMGEYAYTINRKAFENFCEEFGFTEEDYPDYYKWGWNDRTSKTLFVSEELVSVYLNAMETMRMDPKTHFSFARIGKLYNMIKQKKELNIDQRVESRMIDLYEKGIRFDAIRAREYRDKLGEIGKPLELEYKYNNKNQAFELLGVEEILRLMNFAEEEENKKEKAVLGKDFKESDILKVYRNLNLEISSYPEEFNDLVMFLREKRISLNSKSGLFVEALESFKEEELFRKKFNRQGSEYMYTDVNGMIKILKKVKELYLANKK